MILIIALDAYLRMCSIDNHWHPFSIASAPESDCLEFCIEDCGKGSWTNKFSDAVQGVALDSIQIEVLGPYGTPFSSETDECSHVIAIGTGTGIVPMLSLFRQHVSSLLKLDTNKFIIQNKIQMSNINNIYLNKRTAEKSLSSILTNTDVSSRDDVSMPVTNLDDSAFPPSDDEISKESLQRNTMKSVNMFLLQVSLSLVPILGVLTLGMSLSWNTLSEHTIVLKGEEISVEVLHGLREVLIVCTMLLQCLFLIETILIRPATKMSTLLDWVFIVIGFLCDWYWFEEDLWCRFDNSQNLFYSLQVGYMTFRVWEAATNLSGNFFNSLSKYEKLAVHQKVHLVWSSRSALLISKILPEICSQWDELHHKWGDRAFDFCQVSIYVTDKNQSLVYHLKEEIKQTSIARNNWIKFERPNFQDILEDEATERLNGSLLCSNTLVTFCGSKKLATTVHEAKVRCDMATIVSKNCGHVCQFESESYGVRKEERKKSTFTNDEDPNSNKKDLLLRKEMLMQASGGLSFRRPVYKGFQENGILGKDDSIMDEIH